MAKTLNFVYNYVGPTGPLSNQFVPNIMDMVSASEPKHRQLRAFFYEFFDPADVSISVPFKRNVRSPQARRDTWLDLPKQSFLYELGPQWPDGSFKSIFNRESGGVWDTYPHLQEIKIRLQAGTAYVVLSVDDECYCDRDTMDIMHAYFDSRTIPRTSVIYVTNSPTAQAVIKSWYPDGNHIQMEHITKLRHSRYRDPYPDAVTEYAPGARQRMFLCFNRNFHKHRIWFYLAMHKRNLLDKFYISMAFAPPNLNDNFLGYARYIINQDIARHDTTLISALDIVLPKDLDSAGNTLPKELDKGFYSKGRDVINSSQGVMQFYDNSLIHVITETHCYGDFVHVTEKTWKVINFLQPFIVLATRGHLAYLKSLGFKTFHDFWDESYDLIDDHAQRLLAVVDLVSDIGTWSATKQLEFSHAVKPIVDYNFAHYQTLGPIESTAFIERYGV